MTGMLEDKLIDQDIANQVFYGFRLNPADGRLTVEEIGDGNGVVRLPEPNISDPLDYKQWVWTKATLEFRFNMNGHLELKIL